MNSPAAFEKAFAVFPNSTHPANVDYHLETWQLKQNLMDTINNKSSPDSIYFIAMNWVMSENNAYIKANEAELASLPQ